MRSNHWLARIPLLVASLAVALPLPAAGGSSLQVTAGGANSGSFKASLDVAKTCTAGNVAVPNGGLSGPSTQEACGILTANDVDVSTSGGDVVFGGGTQVALGSGFSVTTGGGSGFRVESGPGVLGEAFVRDESPDAESEYNVRFYIDPTGLDVDEATDEFHHLIAYDGGAPPEPEFLIGITFDSGMGGEKRLFVTAFEDDDTPISTQGLCELTLPDTGWHFVEARWFAAASAGANDGDLEVCIDDSPGGAGLCQLLSDCSTFNPLDNDTGEISAVEWGSRAVADGEDLGTLLMDDFDSRRSGPIGPVTP